MAYYLYVIVLYVNILILSFNNGNNIITINAQNVPSSSRLTNLFPHLSFDKDFTQIFGGSNVQIYGNGSNAKISLDKKTGSGLAAKNRYNHGFFSAAIKLPAGFTSGVLSNWDFFPHNHDEIDFELLGHQKSRNWVLQTNMYGNGSVKTGREEKFRLWFDPTTQFHEYSIIWNSYHIVFLVDNIPVREVLNTPAISSSYPSKPMTLYTTIWDGSPWATNGGKYPVNYKYAPFTASLGEMEMAGCIHDPNDLSGKSCSKTSNPSSLDPLEGQNFVKLSSQQIKGLQWARSKHMIYSYCRDKLRYKVMPPECKTR
ncbi:putative xyloglucan endotransglucosylase/hydrolase protein 33 [Bienertia sinuspersici]